MSQVGNPLPFNIAIRIFLAEISYSEAVPDWYTPEEIDYQARETRLSQRAASYLKGAKPLEVLRIELPTRSGAMRTWVVPAVNDQIIFQACVSSIAAGVAKRFDRQHVFSCEPETNPGDIALMKNQLVALQQFQSETNKRLKNSRYILQFDIQKSLASIDRSRFLKFVAGFQPKGPEVDLMRVLLDAWSGKDPGIPVVNDSLFFIGSAYLSEADRLVEKYSKNFIRYMDDYRVFGQSAAELEKVFENVSKAFLGLGFKLNPRKVKLGSSEDYFKCISDPNFVSVQEGSYVTEVDTGIERQLEPKQIAELVTCTLERPDDHLNEGTGRYLLGSLRRYRLNLVMNRRAGNKSSNSPGGDLRRLLARNPKLLRLAQTRLNEYGTKANQAWRTLWMIYLFEQSSVTDKIKKQLSAIESNQLLPTVVKLWARRCREGRRGEPYRVSEELHDLSYLEAGLRCYGDKKCEGEGF